MFLFEPRANLPTFRVSGKASWKKYDNKCLFYVLIDSRSTCSTSASTSTSPRLEYCEARRNANNWKRPSGCVRDRARLQRANFYCEEFSVSGRGRRAVPCTAQRSAEERTPCTENSCTQLPLLVSMRHNRNSGKHLRISELALADSLRNNFKKTGFIS